MPTIPASDIVAVNPSVLPASGAGEDLIGLILTSSTRVPLFGTDNPQVLSFPNAASVSSYFGAGSTQALMAASYFQGIDNSEIKPNALLFAQYNQNKVPAYLRGGNASALLTTLQGVTSGSLEVIVDGFSWKSSTINLSSALTLSTVASTIQSDLALPGSASVTGSIALNPTGTGGILTVTAVSSGTVAAGQTITGSGVLSGTYVTGYGTGTGGTGTYYVNIAQTVVSETLTLSASAAAFTASIAGNVMTVTAVGSGVLQPGMEVTGTNVNVPTGIKSQLTGTMGGVGTYAIYPTQTVSSESMTGAPANITVAYDSTSGGFIFTSGLLGNPSSIQFATRALATTMLLTQATGAVISQGAAPADPLGFMAGVVAQTTNWFGFGTDFDPDNGVAEPPTNKLLFAQWTNSTNNEFAYFALDSDILPTESTSASGSFGWIVTNTTGYSGTVPVWSGTFDLLKLSAALSYAPCLNFSATNGRADFDFAAQTGLVAEVTSEVTAANLRANGYNFYGVWANAGNQWEFFNPGSISGPYKWVDSYTDQVWLNNGLQTALMNGLTTVRSIPFNNAGASLIRSFCLDPINAALNFGAIVPGGTLSQTQIAEINNAAGNTSAAQNVANNGYYLQASIPPPNIRQVRGPWTINLWYFDGESVQTLVVNSIDVQ